MSKSNVKSTYKLRFLCCVFTCKKVERWVYCVKKKRVSKIRHLFNFFSSPPISLKACNWMKPKQKKIKYKPPNQKTYIPHAWLEICSLYIKKNEPTKKNIEEEEEIEVLNFNRITSSVLTAKCMTTIIFWKGKNKNCYKHIENKTYK